MLRYPEFGFVSQHEIEELRQLRINASRAGPGSVEARQYSSTLGVYRRRVTDRTRGGFYQFYGYKEFANHLFAVTHQGVQNKFDVQNLYSRNDDKFNERLMEAVEQGNVKINKQLLDNLSGGLIICDEIHNVYNISEPNNYGLSIQYVLDILGDKAPHAVFMSATPITGSAAEIVDLLNLLVPRSQLTKPLRRTDFFTKGAEGESTFEVSQLRENALASITSLAAGKVSFLLDSDVGSYPQRIFIGEEVPNVPYIRITKCPMSTLHEQSLRAERESHSQTNSGAGLSSSVYTLYNMVFPNPGADNTSSATAVGLYKSSDTFSILRKSTAEWRLENGVILESGSSHGLSSDTDIVTGSFLEAANLGKYSTKYLAILNATIEAIKAGPGKIMIYHHKVRMSGVLLMQEMLKMNGFIDETSNPIDSTLCSVCGIAKSSHGADPTTDADASVPALDASARDTSGTHAYQPARFIVAHSDIERSLMMRSIFNYNSADNINGYKFRIILGSKIIREGYNFKAIRYQFISSLPTDYPTMIQVFGRVVRKDSHADLPPELRNVKIRIFVSTFQSGEISPELQKYSDKGKEYLVIQEVERALHINAVDGFANYDKIKTALSGTAASVAADAATTASAVMAASIDALPYKPQVYGNKNTPIAQSTFLAYGHGEKEVFTITSICRVLFQNQPVWTYNDLFQALKSAGKFNEDNFALALKRLAKPLGMPPTAVVVAGKYYILSKSLPRGNDLDIGSYLDSTIQNKSVSIFLPKFIESTLMEQNWNLRLKKFEHKYFVAKQDETPPPIELCLLDFSPEFHFMLIRKLIMANGESLTKHDAVIIKLYKRFKIILAKKDRLYGYSDPNSVLIYEDGTWLNKQHSEFKIGRRHNENNTIVGFTTSENMESKFKIRPPIQKIQSEHSIRAASKKTDLRNLTRGAVCETHPREDLYKYVNKLKKEMQRTGGSDANNAGAHATADAADNIFNYVVGSAAVTSATDASDTSPTAAAARMEATSDSYSLRFDQSSDKRFPSAISMCNAIKLYLLELEEKSRNAPNGMEEGVRWLYLFNEKSPMISMVV
jgi:hypothetical protein